VADGHVALEARRFAGRLAIDRDRLDPMNGVLQLEVPPRDLRDLERDPGVRGLGADVQEQGPGFVRDFRRGRESIDRTS
jgi:hypothetical protein